MTPPRFESFSCVEAKHPFSLGVQPLSPLGLQEIGNQGGAEEEWWWCLGGGQRTAQETSGFGARPSWGQLFSVFRRTSRVSWDGTEGIAWAFFWTDAHHSVLALIIPSFPSFFFAQTVPVTSFSLHFGVCLNICSVSLSVFLSHVSPENSLYGKTGICQPPKTMCKGACVCLVYFICWLPKICVSL